MSVIEQSRFSQKRILTVEWNGKKYLGAAHGLVGVLYMLMKALAAVPSLSQNSEY